MQELVAPLDCDCLELDGPDVVGILGRLIQDPLCCAGGCNLIGCELIRGREWAGMCAGLDNKAGRPLLPSGGRLKDDGTRGDNGAGWGSGAGYFRVFQAAMAPRSD